MARLTLLLFALGCADPVVGEVERAVVFGSDDRREPYEVESVHAALADQVAVRIVDWAVDRSDPERPRITYERTLGESLDLCDGEPFAEQIAPGSCSATLVDERHLLTAAHCVGDASQCTDSHFWVFGFAVDVSGGLAPLSGDDIYQCTRVVVADEREDYSIIELDRDVLGRVPVDVKLHRDGLGIGTPVTIVGFPDGIPVKIDSGGAVVFSATGRYFRATVDAFDSSSGSGVFDVDGALVGILQRGHPDYVAAGDCNVVNVLDEEGDEGEVVGYANGAMIAYCAANPTSRHCACEGPCWTSRSDAGVDATVDPMLDATVDSSMSDASDASSVDSAIADGGASGCSAGSRSTDRPWIFLLLVWMRARRVSERPLRRV